MIFKLDDPKIEYHGVLPMKVTCIPNFEENCHRIIIINPYSNTGHFDKSDFAYLERLVSFLQRRNYIVYSNTVDDFPPIKGSFPLQCGIQELWSVACKIPLIISIRSGILDYLAPSNVNMLVLYPETNIMRSNFSLTQWECNGKIKEMRYRDFFSDQNFSITNTFLKEIEKSD